MYMSSQFVAVFKVYTIFLPLKNGFEAVRPWANMNQQAIIV